MKKILFSLLIFFSTFLLIHNVFAETISSYTWNNAFTPSAFSLQEMYEFYSSRTDIINNLKTYYDENLSTSYDYYYISGSPSFSTVHEGICLNFTNNSSVKGALISDFRFAFSPAGSYCYRTYPETGYNLIYYNNPSSYNDSNSYDFGVGYVWEFNKPFSYTSSALTDLDSYLEIIFPSYNSTDFNISSFSIIDNNPIPSVSSLYNGTYDSTEVVGYVDINLNDYDYVALSLKDYSQTEKFTTLFYVKGQLCLTPVYDYGLKEKSTYYPDWQPPGCSAITYDFSPQPITILSQDLQHHAIYYLKAFDTNIENIVKVDSSIFDITPVSSENSENPSVVINGRSYPTIPYNQLNGTSTKSEEEGYVSGEVKNVFDVSSDSNFIDTLFSNPLETLGNVWSSIITMFALIGSFIGLLPNTLQVFLYTSFSLAVVLGIIKILL